MRKSKIILAWLMILTLAFQAFGVFADGETGTSLVNLNFEGISEITKTTITDTGMNYYKLLGKQNTETTDVSVSAVTDHKGNAGTAMSITMNKFTGSNYAGNDPRFDYQFKNYNSDKQIISEAFYTETMAFADAGTDENITLVPGNSEGKASGVNAVKISGSKKIISSNNVYLCDYEPGTWVKIAVQYIQSGNSGTYSLYVNGVMLKTDTITNVNETYPGIKYIDYGVYYPLTNGTASGTAMWDNMRITTGTYDPSNDLIGSVNRKIYGNTVLYNAGETAAQFKSDVAHSRIYTDSNCTQAVADDEKISGGNTVVITSANGENIQMYTAAAEKSYINLDFNGYTLPSGGVPDGMAGAQGFSSTDKKIESGFAGCDKDVYSLSYANGGYLGAYLDYAGKISTDFTYETSLFVNEGISLSFMIKYTGVSNAVNALNMQDGVMKIGDTEVGQYDKTHWNNIALVYHKDTGAYDVYLNGERIDGVFTTGQPGVEIEKIRLLNQYNTSGERKVAYRYIKIYDANSFNAKQYTVPSTLGSYTPDSNGNIVAGGFEVSDFMSEIDAVARVYQDSTFAEFDGDYLEEGNILVVESPNGRVYKYYTITGYNKEYFKYDFENGQTLSTNAAKGVKAQNVDGTEVVGSTTKNFMGNKTTAYTMTVNTTGSVGPYLRRDYSSAPVYGDFVIESTFATTELGRIVSKYEGGSIVFFEINNLGAYIGAAKDNRRLSNVKYNAGEWIKAAIVYTASSDTYDIYLNGEKAAENIAAGLAGKGLTEPQMYFYFTEKDGATVGYAAVDNFKLYRGTYNPSGDLITANSTDTIKPFEDAVYIKSAMTANELKSGMNVTDAEVYTDTTLSAAAERAENGGAVVVRSANGEAIKLFKIVVPTAPVVKKFYTTVNGTETNVFAAGTIAAKAELISFETQPSKIILAVYSGKELVNVYVKDIGENGEVSAEVNEGMKVKAFLFKDLTGIMPLAGAISLK